VVASGKADKIRAVLNPVKNAKSSNAARARLDEMVEN